MGASRPSSPAAGRPAAEPRVLGLDEAGRGSVLGPLVLGGFECPLSAVPRLRPLGVRDSKLLSGPRREELARALRRMGRAWTLVVPPSRVDAAVRRGRLNRLEAAGFAELIRRAGPDIVILDACEVDAARFGDEVRGLADFGGVVDSRNHADRDEPVVGAASILAKVRRDRAVAALARRTGAAIGSGYPSDPLTRRYLTLALADGGPVPRHVRRSWKTTATIMAERSRMTLDGFVA